MIPQDTALVLVFTCIRKKQKSKRLKTNVLQAPRDEQFLKKIIIFANLYNKITIWQIFIRICNINPPNIA